MPILQPWDTDPQFSALMAEISGRTVVDKVRCYMLYQYVRMASGEADLAEVGVYKGGTARIIARAAIRGGKLHLFDTFSGMPPCDQKRDMHREGNFADTSLEAVKSFLSDLQGVEFYPGFFPKTTAMMSREQKFSFVHIDADIYRSVMDCCEFFFPRLLADGILLFDDYGAISCPGAKAAVDEYFSRHSHNLLYLPTGQAVVWKGK